MLQISRQQVLERWGDLPDNLKEALFSESSSGIVWQIGALNHLPEEKISIMATIVGDVIFGFLHSDDLAREIQESLNLNSQIANSISHEINRKIFAPIKIDLEKIYSPISAMPFGAAQSRPETKPPAEPFGDAQGKPETEIKIEKESAPKPLEIKPETATKPAVFSTIMEAQKDPTAKPETPIIPVAPIVSTPQDKPFILHQETEAKPVGGKQRTSSPAVSWFQKAMPTGKLFSAAQGRPEKPGTPASPVKIELEVFGQKTEPFGAAQGKEKEPVSAKTEAPKQRIVHYRETEISTPFGKAPNRPFSKPEDSLPKPVKPAITSIDAFEKTKREESEVRLEGNTINLKNNKSNS